MISRRSLVLGVAMFACALSACTEDPTKPPPVVIPGDNEPIVYSKHIAPIWANSCAGSGCHMNGEHFNDLALDSWESTMQGSDYGSVVIPFSAYKSHLFQHINTDTKIAPRALPRMPFGRDELPEDQRRTIQRWINEGAKNDLGDVALSNPSLKRVFVTGQAEDLVTGIDIGTLRVMRYVTVGVRPDSSTPPESPHNIVLSPEGKYFYENLIASGTIEKFDAKTFQKMFTCQVGTAPSQIVVTADGKTLYVSNFDQTGVQRFINRVDAATMQVSKTIEVGGKAPHGVLLSADEKLIYTTNSLSDDISIIDLTNDEIVGRIPMQPGAPSAPDTSTFEPYQAILSKDGNQIFVSCRKSNEVRVVDVNTRKVIDSIKVGKRPLLLAMTPNGSEVWVPNQASDDISIIDVATRTVTQTVIGLPVKVQPHAIAFTSDGSTAFLSCENQLGVDQHHALLGSSKIPGLVYVYGVANRTVKKVIEVAAFAAGIAIDK